MIIYVIEKVNDYIVSLSESHVHFLEDILAYCGVRSDTTSLDTPCMYPSVMQCFAYCMGRCEYLVCDITLVV
jgi:hypothetical protein